METWMNQTWWLYDLTVIAIVTLCIWGGWRRGLIRTAAGLLGYGAALLLSGVLAQPAAELVYNRWLAEPCAAILEQKMEQYHLADSIQQTLNAYGVQLDDASLQQIADHPDSATDQLYTVVSQKTGLPAELLRQGLSQSIDSAASQMFTGLPDWMSEAILPKQDSQELQNRAVQSAALVLSGDTHQAAAKLTEMYVQPVVVSIVKTFTFSVLFLLISALIQGIIKRAVCDAPHRKRSFDRPDAGRRSRRRAGGVPAGADGKAHGVACPSRRRSACFFQRSDHPKISFISVYIPDCVHTEVTVFLYESTLKQK